MEDQWYKGSEKSCLHQRYPEQEFLNPQSRRKRRPGKTERLYGQIPFALPAQGLHARVVSDPDDFVHDHLLEDLRQHFYSGNSSQLDSDGVGWLEHQRQPQPDIRCTGECVSHTLYYRDGVQDYWNGILFSQRQLLEGQLEYTRFLYCPHQLYYIAIECWGWGCRWN